jgi:hypothetical protein
MVYIRFRLILIKSHKKIKKTLKTHRKRGGKVGGEWKENAKAIIKTKGARGSQLV